MNQPPGDRFPPGGQPPQPGMPAQPAQPGHDPGAAYPQQPAQPQYAQPEAAPQQYPPQPQHGVPPGQAPPQYAAPGSPPAPQAPQAGYGAPPVQPQAAPAAQPTPEQAYGAPPAQPPTPEQAYGAPPAQPTPEQAYGAPPAQPTPEQAYGAPPAQPTPEQAYGAPPAAPGVAEEPPAAYPEPPVDEIPAVTRAKAISSLMRITGILVFLFGLVCLGTALVFSFDSGKVIKGAVPPTGGTLGPIVVDEPDTVLLIEVFQPQQGYGWTYVSGELLDAEQEFLFGFGQELWHEKGYDDGPWDEALQNFDIKVTVPQKGTYFAFVEAEQQPANPIGGNIGVTISPKMGSSVPHFTAGIAGLIFGLLFFIGGVMMNPVRIQVDDD